MADRCYSIGIVCGGCDSYSPLGTLECPICHRSLTISVATAQRAGNVTKVVSGEPAGKSPLQTGDFDRLSQSASHIPPRVAPIEDRTEEELMDQVKHYVCDSCMTPVPRGHKFCGRCGASVPDEAANLRVKLFSDMQNPEKARLLLIRGDGRDGLSYHLKAEQHVVGRQGQIEFPDDPFVSPRHANLFYRDGKLVVRDEGSVNGVYFRVRGTVELVPGDTFMAGEQLFRLDPAPRISDAAESDGTFFYSSPKYTSNFRLTQILEGGALGMTVCARGTTLQVGREDGDLNFPGDVYMSAKHVTIEERDGRFYLTDHESRNGTYIRIKSEQILGHGDYMFIGRKLLRVELNVN
jgi:pSer/pThr/pTyr-binding forkhead associated (FHA) protein